MPIYKDECVYTFDNQESPHGVDVCLTCFIGTSPDPHHDFTAHHRESAGHTAFLNLRKVVRPQAEKSSKDPIAEEKPASLGFRAENDEEKYDLHSTFKTLGNDDESTFSDAINKVLTSDSYSKTQQTESWELELEPCEHVAIHESVFENKTPQPLSSETLSHCSQCEFSKNLWLCLECGNLGCGRRQFDGSGGNSHGLAHYEETQHPLAVKLGSITPEGHADVFCYACNDDKKDPKIREHLSFWGIDIAKQTKTEKSMVELQLEQNLNWDFTSGTDGEPLNGKGYTGMKNLGNTCYLNSVVQCLFKIPEFADAFEANDPSRIRDAASEAPNSLRTQLNKMKDGLQSGRYDVIIPEMFKYLVGKGHAEFATARQQDAFEYLTYLLTKVSQGLPGDLPAELFGFQTERRIACSSCGAVRYITENQENFSVAVPIEELPDHSFKPVTLYELFDLYTHDEEVESKCPRCDAPAAVSSVKFKTLPKILITNVRRFRIVNWVPQKVDVPCIIPPGPLVLDKYFSKGPQPGETIIDNDAGSEDTFTADPAKLEMLVGMGFSEETSAVALRIASERGYGDGDLEAAIEILMSGEADQAATSAPGNAGASAPNAEAVSMLVSMGFPEEQAAAALQENNSNVEAAVEWLFAGNFETYQPPTTSQEDQMDVDVHKERGEAGLPAKYELSSIICHKGASVHVGHYIAAAFDGNEGVVFNDERVNKGTDMDELQKFAYIYMFRRL